MYNNMQPAGGGPYGPPPSFGGGFHGHGPPNYGGPPPGMGPGPGAPPGAATGQKYDDPQSSRPRDMPPNFQPPPNLPNINFNAPVIHLGLGGPPKPTLAGGPDMPRRDPEQRPMRAGLGMEMHSQRQAIRENMAQLLPPNKDEVAKTIFIGGVTGVFDQAETMEQILRCVGNLRRWIRALDSDGKPCKFGFAEYEDSESLATAIEMLKSIKVNVGKRTEDEIKEEKEDDEMTTVQDEAKVKQEADGEDDAKDSSSQAVEETAETQVARLLVFVDDATYKYLDQWKTNRADQDPIQAQFRVEAARVDLDQIINRLENPGKANGVAVDAEGQDQMDGQNHDQKPENSEVVNIPLAGGDDELADIPAEMRENVLKEIQAFRDRSLRRDLERLKKEEEMEANERRRAAGASRTSRLASPPPSGLSGFGGPGGGANGIPLGPRDRGAARTRDSQIPKDYQQGVSFVDGSGLHGAGTNGYIDREHEDSDASDEEIERRKMEKIQAEQDKAYQDQKRRWLNREKSRSAAVEREKTRDRNGEAHIDARIKDNARWLSEWDDDAEAARKVHEYYADHSLWARNRLAFRTREAANDDLDRADENHEQMRDQRRQAEAAGAAPGERRTSDTTGVPKEPQRFKLSLGAAAQKAQAANSSKRTAAEVEGLLEDEADVEQTSKRTLVPIKFDNAADAMGLTEEERAQAVRQLAADIPTDKAGLWKWPVKWDFVDEAVLTEQLKPFVEKKIVEYLGVQEQMLVEVVEEHIRKRGDPQALIGELEGALDEEAEVLVKKLWRMVIFFSESEMRGLSSS